MLLLTYSGFNSSGFGSLELFTESRLFLLPALPLVMETLNFFRSLFESFLTFESFLFLPIGDWRGPLEIWPRQEWAKAQPWSKDTEQGGDTEQGTRDRRMMVTAHRHRSYYSQISNCVKFKKQVEMDIFYPLLEEEVSSWSRWVKVSISWELYLFISQSKTTTGAHIN